MNLNKRALPISRDRGDELVAWASFGTQIGVSILVGFAVFVFDPKPLYFITLLLSIVGSSLGFLLWRNGHQKMATLLGTGGLLCAGVITHLFLGTVGGPTGILLLASVITAGGLGGRWEATITSVVVLIAITLGYLFFPTGDEMYQLVVLAEALGIDTSGVLPNQNASQLIPEVIMLAFVGFSVPCWGAYVVALDTSNRRARAKAEAALEERASLAARIQRDQQLESLVRVSGEVAHDFNNTLMVISGTIDILEHHSDFPRELNHNLQMMRNATKISAGLTNKLLDFCQGKTTPLVQINPVNTIQELFPLLEFTIRSKGNFVFSIPPQSNRTLEISSGKLEQVILNLITNARDAISVGGEIRLEVEYSTLVEEKLVQCREEKASHLCISVVDDGIGMSLDVQEKVLEPFYSNKPSPHQGGLGLSIVHGIVLQSKGILKINSKEGKGTTITVAFPLDTESLSLDVEPKQGGGTKILLIDDDPDVLYAVARQLELLGYSVREANSVTEALELLKQEQFLLMITDIRINEESGFELAKEIRRRKYAVPILYMTGFSGFYEERDSNKVILLKPFDGIQLQEKINQVLEYG